jgi:hypothetical protein
MSKMSELHNGSCKLVFDNLTAVWLYGTSQDVQLLMTGTKSSEKSTAGCTKVGQGWQNKY